ncbi:inverse autotransporter beta domain-containing protein [Xenorhabdus eapokensis]|uniref:Putative Bacterial Ig-like domain n=1 Tax=Xenorhabdus eapokensis TaxID=1873482 RepID=A0A1Q5TH81_9GAMM|nr:inverse autotransporter beta domain-containing protein [Xenorhabdus eapokensis]OKO99584.1 putative Bacterial Ig-like domain [Xenorhabdus eapokensis]
MSSCVKKIIFLIILFYTLFMLSTTTSASVEHSVQPKKQETYLNNTYEPDTSKIIHNNMQVARNILSSSPSELKEQATYYALSRFNNTISSEVQKWLSQFGTVKINFGLDRKGSLKNSSLDLLLPLYDNKTNWLFFSQFGYRNKDSRDTVNFGLGGRYFYQNWMYGLNTFYDYDIIGKNRRVGFGSEIWGNYIKLSANAYYRLSDWQQSRKFQYYHERPANGYNINGEFYLPFYPNLGTNLSYEQYFGDNVTLFDRKTKQKNPSLAKIGLTYTPIPLITIGADYKQGTGNRTEMQFLANLNIKLGSSLSEQLSPDNVASMRTLAGSRYDLVERNNNIVLDHRSIPTAQFSLQKATVIGYSRQQINIPIKLPTDTSIKKIHIYGEKERENFEKNKGKIFVSSNGIQVVLPEFLNGKNEKNVYTFYTVAELSNNQKTEPQHIQLIVKPFEIYHRDEANFTPSGPLPASGDTKDGYTFSPVITFDTSDKVPSEITIDNVQWVTEPPADKNSGLEFHPQYKFEQIKTDKNGYFLKDDRVILTSTKSIKDVKVYLVMDSQPKKLLGTVSFTDNTQSYQVKEIEVTPDGDLTADGEQTYTYKALIVDNEKNPAINKKLSEVNWNIDNPVDGLTLHVPKDEIQTDSEGKLKATLTSNKKADGIWVSLTIEKQSPVKAPRAVSFKLESISVQPDSAKLKSVHDTYTYTAIITNSEGKAEKGKTVQWSLLESVQGVTLDPVTTVTDGDGKVTAKLTSSVAASNIIVTASSGGNTGKAQQPANFAWPVIHKPIVTPKSGDVSNDGSDAYTYTAMVYEPDGTTIYTGQKIKFEWSLQQPTGDKTTYLKTSGDVTTSPKGELTNNLVSSHNPPIKDAVVCVAIAGNRASENGQQCADKVSFAEPVKLENISVQPDSAKLKSVHDTYTYTAIITNSEGKAEKGKTVQWSLLESVQGVTLDPVTTVTDGDGKVTAKLTSSVAASNIIVTASSGGNTGKAQQPANFAWPVIHKPIVTPKSGDVSNDGSDAYTYTAMVYEPDGTTIYTGQKIKFEWSLQQPTGDKTTYLKTSGDVTTSPKGELTNNLVSSHNPPIKDAVVCVAIAGNRASENGQQCADKVSFDKAYTLTFTVIRPTSTLEGKANQYTFIATIKRKKDNGLQPGVPINWGTSLPVPLAQEPHLITTQENITNSQGQATFTMYSDNGGFDNITVTAAADNSSPDSKSETVKITARPKNDDNHILLYHYNGQKGLATTRDGVLARNLTFGWDKLRFIPKHNANNPEIAGANAYPAYNSNNENIIIVAVKNDTGDGYFEVKAAGSTTVESRYTFPSGRYLVYQTNIAINKMVFADTGGVYGKAVSYAYPPERQFSPAMSCTTGSPVETTDIEDSITELVKQGTDLKAAGLIGDIDGVDFIGANTSGYTQAYPLSSSHKADLFILLCY